MKQITFKQYKAIDISILSVLLLVFEALSIYASSHWFSHSGIALVPLISLTPLVVMITMMRWSEFALITALVGGISYCAACGGKVEQYITYCIGNLFALFALLIIKKLGKEEVRKNTFNLVLISISTYLFITIGRWLVSLIFEPTFKTLPAFITTDIISLVVLIVGVIALRKSEGILEDQKAYLLRLDREKRELAEERAAMARAPYCESNYDDGEDLPDEAAYFDEDFSERDILDDDSVEGEEELTEVGESDESEIPEPEIPETEYLPDAAEMPIDLLDEEAATENDYNNDELNSEDKI